MSNAIRYTVIPSQRWKNTRTGATASMYGAVPWTNEAERIDWFTQDVGFTVRNEVTGTVGIGRAPWPTQELAQQWADRENARLAECARKLTAPNTYSVRYVHKISPRDTDTHADVVIPSGAFSNCKTLGAALRSAGVLSKGVRLSTFRVEADKVVAFPASCPWHSVILTKTT